MAICKGSPLVPFTRVCALVRCCFTSASCPAATRGGFITTASNVVTCPSSQHNKKGHFPPLNHRFKRRIIPTCNTIKKQPSRTFPRCFPRCHLRARSAVPGFARGSMPCAVLCSTFVQQVQRVSGFIRFSTCGRCTRTFRNMPEVPRIASYHTPRCWIDRRQLHRFTLWPRCAASRCRGW